MKKTTVWYTLSVLLVSLLSFAQAQAGQAKNPGQQGPEKPYFPDLNREVVSPQAAQAAEVGKPIIWIVIDALRPDHMTPYGYGRNTTPALKKFADEGVIFTRFFANAPWTRPATTTMLTGQIPSGHRVQCDWDKLPDDVPTVAEQLQRAGYTTLAVVGNGNASSAFHLNRGFDEFRDTKTDWKGLPNARQVFDVGLELLSKHRGKDKVFLFMFVVDPHDPYRPKAPYNTMFMGDYKGKVRHRVHWEYKNDYPEGERQSVLALYDGLIRYTDDQLARLFGQLKKMGYWDEASTFVTADHGEAFGEHGIYLHAHHHYETHLRIPLLINAPWLKETGRYSDTLLQQIDLGPTFIQLAGAKQPAQMNGRSIVDALSDRASFPADRPIISEYKCYGINRSAIRTGQHKLVYQQKADRAVFKKHIKRSELLPSVSFDKETFLLFDLLADPFEQEDIWGKVAPQLAQKLLGQLKKALLQKQPSSQTNDVDPQLVEQLRSMGYMQ